MAQDTTQIVWHDNNEQNKWNKPLHTCNSTDSDHLATTFTSEKENKFISPPVSLRYFRHRKDYRLISGLDFRSFNNEVLPPLAALENEFLNYRTADQYLTAIEYDVDTTVDHEIEDNPPVADFDLKKGERRSR